MVEFKLDEKNRGASLMEVNGRFLGSLPLAINAGVDFPYLLYKIMVEKDTSATKGYKLDFTERWLIPGDLLWLFDSLFRTKNLSLLSLNNFYLLHFYRMIFPLDDFTPTIGVSADVFRYLFEVSQKKRTICGEIFDKGT
jgi:predicted ATP-grasp superfamily ATP-dependent carboligase